MRFGTMGGACGWDSARVWPPLGFFWWGTDWPPRSERERWIRILEERQRDFEQAAADLADLLRRLRDDADQEHTQQA
jgi:hypothetical protein